MATFGYTWQHGNMATWNSQDSQEEEEAGANSQEEGTAEELELDL